MLPLDCFGPLYQAYCSTSGQYHWERKVPIGHEQSCYHPAHHRTMSIITGLLQLPTQTFRPNDLHQISLDRPVNCLNTVSGRRPSSSLTSTIIPWIITPYHHDFRFAEGSPLWGLPLRYLLVYQTHVVPMKGRWLFDKRSGGVLPLADRKGGGAFCCVRIMTLCESMPMNSCASMMTLWQSMPTSMLL